MDQSSCASSFYEPPVKYDEGKVRTLYENLKTNFEDIHDSLKTVKKNLSAVRKESVLTVELLEKIEVAKVDSQNEDARS